MNNGIFFQAFSIFFGISLLLDTVWKNSAGIFISDIYCHLSGNFWKNSAGSFPAHDRGDDVAGRSGAAGSAGDVEQHDGAAGPAVDGDVVPGLGRDAQV